MALSARSAMLQSVFPSASDSYSSPTPQATPLLTQESFSQPADTDYNETVDPSDTAAEGVRWERAWHAATSFLSEKLQVAGTNASAKSCPKDVRAAISYLRSSESLGWKLRRTDKAYDLLWWHSQAVQEQLLKRHGPGLQKLCMKLTDDPATWIEFRHRLIICRSSLMSPIEHYIVPIISPKDRRSLTLLDDAYRALVTQLLIDRVRQPLTRFLRAQISIALQDADTRPFLSEDSMDGIETTTQQEAKNILKKTLSDLIEGGFPVESMERLLARTFDSILKSHVSHNFSKRWESPSPNAHELKQWVAGPFSELATNILKTIRTFSHHTQHSEAISKSSLGAWQQTVLRELGLLRLKELFDIIVEWDSGTRGGIEDLKHFITTPQTRMQVVNHFNDVLSYRLLHPGASTAEILQIYIRIMRAFAVLDRRFVILDRVGRPIRRYLRDREDTIRIIVAGLLSDPGDPESSPDALGELATELHEMDELADVEDGDELDWDDMSWVPNPADAEADYKSSKGLDVIGNLLTLFESKDTVVREFQNILGERLLSPESDFSREIRVLELLKSRFGEASLQGCEVMIKDIFDSGRTDHLIKKEQKINQETTGQPNFYAKILSRFFWPSLRDDEFRIPAEVQTLRDRYSHGFEEHKMQRKLAWLPSLGQVSVELQLEDRTLSELVSPSQASVIYAFREDEDVGNDASKGPSPPMRTAQQLAESLEMDDDLVANALSFWVSKLVLYQPEPGPNKAYRVLETLPPAATTGGDDNGNENSSSSNINTSKKQPELATAATPAATSSSTATAAAVEQEASVAASIVAAAQSAQAAAAATAASAVRSGEELAEEKMEVLWQYVVGMLTNQGAMPLQQMVMMLNFVVPGGFMHSQDEFRHFLQRKVDDGRLQMAGASFRMPKK